MEKTYKLLKIGAKYSDYQGDIVIVTSDYDGGKIYHMLEKRGNRGFHIGFSTDGKLPDGWTEVEDVSPYPFSKPDWREVTDAG